MRPPRQAPSATLAGPRPDGRRRTVGRVVGRAGGRAVARSDGRSNGRTVGPWVGRADGRAFGRTGGWADGRTGGPAVGRADGRVDGWAGGRAVGRTGGPDGRSAGRWAYGRPTGGPTGGRPGAASLAKHPSRTTRLCAWARRRGLWTPTAPDARSGPGTTAATPRTRTRARTGAAGSARSNARRADCTLGPHIPATRTCGTQDRGCPGKTQTSGHACGAV